MGDTTPSSETQVDYLNQELEAAQDELRQLRTDFELFFSHFLDAILVVNSATGRITMVNDSAVRLLRYPRDELISSDFRMLFPDDQSDDQQGLFGELHVHGHAFHEQSFLRSDGEPVLADLSASMVLWHGHESILIVLRDATERRRHQKQALEAEEIRARYETVARLSHEINNPLQELLTRVELDNDERYQEPVMRIAKVLRALREQESTTSGTVQASAALSAGPEKALEPCLPNAIMVVDDEDAIRKLVVTGLERSLSELTIDTATSGVGAVQQFEEKHHELIVMDVNMPEMNGADAFLRIMEICREREWETPSVVFCTGYNTPANVRAAVETNPKHLCLLKPVGMARIVDAVRERVTGCQG